MATIEHRDRRNAASPVRIYSLSGEALVWAEETGMETGEMPFADIRQVRLGFEMAGRDSQIVCRVTDKDGREAVFGSMRWSGVGQWEMAADTFRDLLGALHAALLPRRDEIRFIEGSSMTFMIAMFGLGLAMTAVSLFFFVLLVLIREQRSGLFLIGGILAGGWLCRVFWPRGPKPYDPQKFAATDDAGVG